MADQGADAVGGAAAERSDAGSEAADPAASTVPSAAEILARWREAERRRDAAEPGSAERDAAEAECDELARAYQDAHSARADLASDLAKRAAEPV